MLEEPTATSKEAKTNLQMKYSGAGALQSIEDCSVLQRSDPMEGKTHQTSACLPHAGRIFVTYFAFAN